MNLLRVYLTDMNSEEAMNELLKRMRGTMDNYEFLASMNGQNRGWHDLNKDYDDIEEFIDE